MESRTAGDNWTDEECRYLLQLYADEKKKGNRPKTGMNQTGQQFIIKKFEEKYKKGYTGWISFKRKLDTCKKAYARYRALTHRTGIGYDSMGRVEMPEHWWEQRIEEWEGARRLKTKCPANLDLLEEEYGSITVTGGEGWSAQQGEDSLNSKVGGDDEDGADSVDIVKETQAAETQNETAETQTQAGAGGSSRSKGRKGKDMILATATARNEILAKKNKIAEEMLEREFAYSVDCVIEILNELPGVRKWSRFHKAAIKFLMANDKNRQAFIAFPEAEDKISFMELMLGTSVDA